jgi:hypothetical protein
MDLHGSLSDNLQSALKSVIRHRNLAVHGDTRAYWDQLLRYAQDAIESGDAAFDVPDLAAKLKVELSERDRREAFPPL